MAQSWGLNVIARIGPYMDAEQDMVGLPAWLLKDRLVEMLQFQLDMSRDIRLRTSDPRYITAVRSYMNAMLPVIRPLLYPNGGPVGNGI
jgi:beta-galactosidase GanA